MVPIAWAQFAYGTIRPAPSPVSMPPNTLAPKICLPTLPSLASDEIQPGSIKQFLKKTNGKERIATL